MYEQLIERIEQKADVLNKKCGRKGKLRVKVIDGATGVNSNTNVLTIDRSLLFQWQNGEISEIDVDGTLAHEFGHLVEHSKDKLGRKSDGQLTLYIMGFLVVLGAYYAAGIPQPEVGYSVITLIWIALLPFVLRRIYVSGELAADRNAINLSLISDEQMANCILNRIGRYQKKSVSPLELLRNIDNFVSHPFLAEQLANIGFEIERPIKAKRLLTKRG